MKKTKIIFFDIDGTLIGMGKGKMTETMRETLLALKKNGIRICIATGRPYCNIPDMDGVEFDAFLTFNGSYCCTRENMIHQMPIPAKDVQKIIENASRIHRPVSIATANQISANGSDGDLEEYFAMGNHKLTVSETFEWLAKEEIYQIMMGATQEEHARILQGVEKARITAWCPYAVDIIPVGSGKGNGVEKILDYFQLTKEEAIAFGDGANDIEMLQTVGTGIAMGNATEDVKAIADEICKGVEEEGIYDYCKRKHLI